MVKKYVQTMRQTTDHPTRPGPFLWESIKTEYGEVHSAGLMVMYVNREKRWESGWASQLDPKDDIKDAPPKKVVGM